MGKAPNTPRIKSTTNLSGGIGKLLLRFTYFFFIAQLEVLEEEGVVQTCHHLGTAFHTAH